MSKSLLMASLIGCVSLVGVHRVRANAFDAFDKMWEDMEQNMLTSMKRSRHLLKELHSMNSMVVEDKNIGEITVSEDKDADTVTVAIPIEGSCDSDFKVEIEDEIAKVTIPVKDGEMQIAVADRFISIHGSSHAGQTVKKSEEESIAKSSSQFHIEQLLPARVDVTSVKPECRDSKLLLIFAKKSTKRVITVENNGLQANKSAAKLRKNKSAAIAEGMK